MLPIRLSALAALAEAHFVLQVPTSLGFSDVLEGTAPCGSFHISSRVGESSWPVAGAPFQLITTHPQSDWQIRAALLNDTANFQPLVPVVSQQGTGTFCLPAVPGIAAWEGQDAVLQAIQHSVDGELYQCAAIKFVSGSAAAAPQSCKNSTNVSASFKPGSTATSPGNSSTTTSHKSAAGKSWAESASGPLMLAAPLLVWLAVLY
ncbi:hypothetical protein B0T24DRAFT_700017 [Lasiosphaeria ovina]|uniref:Copper acquisition factor BIM1-like domain-containing protein n=1 Tax=Lasiosphaeria ovina TaxID=92902 RepID=A0AAE0NBE6_9PEZI|nr:hypothetical protein B0T24DRAFT_700017 [Lasiosphaeria ovina]